MGIRTLKPGQSRFYLGYQKHTLRLWLSRYEPGVLLVPLVSWATPANLAEGRLLLPSLRYCQQRWRWHPDIVVGDLGYLEAATKAHIRQRWQATVITGLKENMLLVAPFETPMRPVCPQGQLLQWLGYDPADERQWFGVRDPQPLCTRCWEATVCPREFGYAAAGHETLLGQLPLGTKVAQRLLQQVRPWIEPTQSYEKNQLGLSQVFLNSLRLVWVMCLLADAVVLLRACLLIHHPARSLPLNELTPQQMNLDLDSRFRKCVNH